MPMIDRSRKEEMKRNEMEEDETRTRAAEPEHTEEWNGSSDILIAHAFDMVEKCASTSLLGAWPAYAQQRIQI